jgi:hypothetical protein
VSALGGCRSSSAARPLYHAAAVLASNYLVALPPLRRGCWARPASGRRRAAALLPLLRGTLDNIEQLGVPAALTGPIARGDSRHVRLHLARLSAGDRVLYCGLGLELLRLAREAGSTSSAPRDRIAPYLRLMRLHINVDHVATVRQARRTDEPDPVRAAVLAELGGADGITVHLREDRRHIQDRDVRLLMQTVRTGVNLELAAASDVLDIACELRPMEATLVPERREEITTEGGLALRAAHGRVRRGVSPTNSSVAWPHSSRIHSTARSSSGS